ncbi:MAG: adenylate/guanylate cyclase domain-containing protein [Planctomycetota bacterium]
MEAPTGVVTLVFVEGPAGLDPRAGLAAAGGFEVKSSPGACMAAFAEAGAAVRFALGAQLQAAPAGVRVGIATGEAIVERDTATGRADYFGPTVNRAARIMNAAHPGQTLLSETARAAAGDIATVRDLGEHRLRGIERPERLHLALPPEWSAREFPPLRTLRTVPTNLPPQSSTFVGRDKELVDLASLLESPGARFVTVTGGAGVGKTRLAVREAAARVDRTAGGVWFADLAEERGADGIARVVAEAMGHSGVGTDAVAATGAAIEARGPVLIVLDTFDLHLAHAAATAGAWAARAPQARFLFTSRVPIGLPGERELRIEPLPDNDAIRLFADRAREARPDFELGLENAGDVARICSELDGLPLAIELAAARVRIMRPAEMVKKLGQKFQLLRSARKDTTARQMTLAAAIEWSEEQLAPWERSALRQLSVFRGGCCAEAADAVVDLAAHPGAPAGSAAARALVTRGLLVAREGEFGTRFAMSRTLLDYASSRLPAEGPEGRGAVEERHTAWVVKFAAYLESPAALGDARDFARPEIENVFAVQDRLQGRKGSERTVAEVVASIRSSFLRRGPLQEGADRFAKAREAFGSAQTDADIQIAMKLALGHLRILRAMGKWKEALVIAEESVRLGRLRPPAGLLTDSLWELAYTAGSFSDYQRSDAALAEAEQIARDTNNTIRLVSCLFLKTARIRGLGDAAGALVVAEEALELARQRPERADAFAEALNGVANALSETSDPVGSIRLFREAMAIDERLGNESGMAMRLGNLGDALCDVGEFPAALEAYDKAAAIDRRLGRQTYVMYGLIRRSAAVRALGDPAGALALLEQARPQLDRTGSGQLHVIWVHHRLQALLSLGLAAAVAGEYEEALRLSRADEDAVKAAGAVSLGVRALLRLGRAAEARTVFTREFPAGVPLKLSSTDRFMLFATQALVYEATGATDEARASALEAAELARQLLRSHGPRNAVLAEFLQDVTRLRG